MINENRVGLYTIEGIEESWIETFTGRYVNPLKFKPDDIDIIDIAHALSMVCRFNGHCNQFYSVAEHSLRVCNLMGDNDDKLTALLHDASEAYMADITRPVKWALPEIRKVESIIEIVINEKFGLKGDWVNIKKADNILLATEARDLMLSKGKNWYLPYNPLDEKIIPYNSELAKCLFLCEFNKLRV